MTISSGQRVYFIRHPNGLWARKTGTITKVDWVDDLSKATFWKKLHHVKSSLKEGVFSLEKNLDGLPVAAFYVVECMVTIERTGRRRRLSELERFHEKGDSDDGIPSDV